MPDKWAQYAVPSAAPAADKWAQYAQPAAAAPPKQAAPVGGDMRALTEREQMENTAPVGVKGEGAFENVHNSLRNAFTGAYGVLAHPINTATAMAKSVIPGNDTPNPLKQMYDGLNTRPGETLSTMAGQTAATAGLGKVAGAPLEAVGGKMQDAGASVINHTVGALAKDFRRGSNPGQGYFQAGLGPSLSMDSIASKASAAKSATGAKIGSLYDTATQEGMKIPVNDVAAAIQKPVQNAMATVTGPGGTGNTAPLEQFGASFRPPIQAATEDGGFTPNSLFSMKRNVSANTTWNDPTQAGLRQVQQQTAGGIGGVLSKHVPGAADLNSEYQNVTSLANRANARALTGSSPLTALARKGAAGVGAAALGHLYSPMASAMAGIGAMALDSIPARTTLASGLYYGGKGATAMGKGIQSLYGPKRP